jgi:hypothetical protein
VQEAEDVVDFRDERFAEPRPGGLLVFLAAMCKNLGRMGW